MIEYITNFMNWYWSSPEIPLKTGGFLVVLSFVPYFLLSAWRGRPLFNADDEDEPVILHMVGIAFIFILSSLLVAAIWPLVLFVLILSLIYYFVSSWGNSYRKVVQSQETKRLSALAQLIRDDPDVKKSYDKLMEEESLNTTLQ